MDTHLDQRISCFMYYCVLCIDVISQTNERKESMCFMLRDALRVGCIGLSKHFFSNSMEKREMLKILDDEMRNFSVLVEAPKTPFGKGRKTYSGKVGCKWIRTTDRLLMTLSHSHTLHTGRWAQRRRYYHNVRTRKLNRSYNFLLLPCIVCVQATGNRRNSLLLPIRQVPELPSRILVRRSTTMVASRQNQ
jgi:hypothetical protein